MNYKRLILFGAMGLLGTGCGKVQLQLDGLNPLPEDLFVARPAAELLSGAQTSVTTLGGYKVDATLGSMYTEQYQTTAGGYKVFSTLQGQISSAPTN